MYSRKKKGNLSGCLTVVAIIVLVALSLALLPLAKEGYVLLTELKSVRTVVPTAVAPVIVTATPESDSQTLVEKKYEEAIEAAVGVMAEKRAGLEATQEAIRATISGGGG